MAVSAVVGRTVTWAFGLGSMSDHMARRALRPALPAGTRPVVNGPSAHDGEQLAWSAGVRRGTGYGQEGSRGRTDTSSLRVTSLRSAPQRAAHARGRVRLTKARRRGQGIYCAAPFARPANAVETLGRNRSDTERMVMTISGRRRRASVRRSRRGGDDRGGEPDRLRFDQRVERRLGRRRDHRIKCSAEHRRRLGVRGRHHRRGDQGRLREVLRSRHPGERLTRAAAERPEVQVDDRGTSQGFDGLSRPRSRCPRSARSRRTPRGSRSRST